VEAHLSAAQPGLLVPGARQHLVLLVPPGPAGEAFRDLAVQAARDLPVTVFPSETDVLVCFEAAGQPLPAVAAALVGGGAAELAQRVLGRHDVEWAPLPLAPGGAETPR
jgi:hypothetical protein